MECLSSSYSEQQYRKFLNTPHFFCVGPQRTATTWLYQRLLGNTHLPNGVKETLFFDKHFSKELSWYLDHFSEFKTDETWGEVAPTYFHSKEARERIYSLFPKARIVITLRDPIERLLSLYRLMRQYGWTSESFESSWNSSDLMKESSRYDVHVNAWFDTFGRSQVKVILFDDLLCNQKSFLESFCSFVNIDSIDLSPGDESSSEKEKPARFPALAWSAQVVGDYLRSKKLYFIINAAKKLGLKKVFFAKQPGNEEEIPDSLRQELKNYFSPMIDSLEPLIDRDLSSWR